MAINLDKASQLYAQSMELPIPLNTAATNVIDHVDQLKISKVQQISTKQPNPSLVHLTKVPFENWQAWREKNHDDRKIRFFIRSVMGRCVPIECEPWKTVGDLKQLIFEAEDIPKHLIRLRTKEGLDLEKDNHVLDKDCGFTFEKAKGDPNNVTLRCICRESVMWR